MCPSCPPPKGSVFASNGNICVLKIPLQPVQGVTPPLIPSDKFKSFKVSPCRFCMRLHSRCHSQGSYLNSGPWFSSPPAAPSSPKASPPEPHFQHSSTIPNQSTHSDSPPGHPISVAVNCRSFATCGFGYADFLSSFSSCLRFLAAQNVS